MARNVYVKANPIVAKYLGVRNRMQFPDGNYLLNKLDFAVLGGGSTYDFPIWAKQMGLVLMGPEEVYAEQNGGASTPMPEPEDVRWRMPKEGNDEGDNDASVEEPAEEAGEPVTATETDADNDPDEEEPTEEADE